MTVASFSALAIVTAAVLYLMALVFHTLEWALARNVEATVTESVAADGKGGVALLDKPSVAPVPPRRADVFARMGFNLTILAAVVDLMGIVARGIAAHRAPWGNMYEFVTTAAVVTNSYMLPHGARCAAMPRATMPIRSTTAARMVRLNPIRAKTSALRGGTGATEGLSSSATPPLPSAATDSVTVASTLRASAHSRVWNTSAIR